MAEEETKERRNEGEDDGDPAAHSATSPLHSSVPSSSPFRSTFGFDHTDEQWFAMVRQATAPLGPGELGPYKVLGEIGRGSQGAVFKALQPGTNRAIAIKRLAAGALAGSSARARFEREVETASALSHPCIVTVLGTDTIDGQPVLLMEWVDGQPIDRWALEPLRPLRERLELFARVCDAVSHAHQHGVLHRDLKPGNILVDREGRPRVLDFGLAKLVGDLRMISHAHPGLLGTPAFAAPEQVAGSDATDTRTDVYSLGAILYLLLTGRLPFEQHKDFPDLLQAIAKEPPRRPSLLDNTINAELDAITLTALAKEPPHRYQSADALAADIRRHLAGQVVLAHPPSAAYQLRKLMSRHRLLFSIAAGATLTVSAFAIVSSLLAARLAAKGHDLTDALAKAQAAQQNAQTHAARSTASAEFLESMLDSMGQAFATGEVRPARTMLLSARARLESGNLAIDPELEVTLWRRLAQTSLKLDMPKEGDELTQIATHLCEERLGADHTEMGYCKLLQGFLAENRRDLEKAESLYRESARIFKATLGTETREYALAINNIGCVIKDLDRHDDARQCLHEAVTTWERLFGPVNRDVAMGYRNLGTIEREHKNYDKAADYYEKAMAAAKGCPATDQIVVSIRTHLAKMARDQGNLDEAERLARDEVATIEHAYGDDCAMLISALTLVTDVLNREKRYSDAAQLQQRAALLCDKHLPADHPTTAQVQYRLGSFLFSADRPTDAEPAFRSAAKLYAACDPPNPAMSLRCSRSVVACLTKQGRADEAKVLSDRLDKESPPKAPTPSGSP